ncbi:hypothetical protein N665_2064s0001 [Sinapis alba]|nr:hypothetical protein N665_2064s0001 [Sinapis alba]
MSTTKTWLQAISWIQTRKQSTISISSNDCVSSLLSMVKLLFQKSKRSILVSTIRGLALSSSQQSISEREGGLSNAFSSETVRRLLL